MGLLGGYSGAQIEDEESAISGAAAVSPGLDMEFALGPPRIIVSSIRRPHLDKRQMRYILWARAQGISARRAAEELRVNPKSVARFLRRVRDYPLAFTDCGFMVRVGKGPQRVYRCGMCAETYADKEAAARHGYDHIFGVDLLDVPIEERGWHQRELRRRGQG